MEKMNGRVKVRESNYELLRLICMFMIVLYHLLAYVVYPSTDVIVYKALWLPLHVAVVCFVLISGYFLIKPTIMGLAKLLIPLIFFYYPFVFINILSGSISANSILSPPYWFIRVYLYLFLFSPVINYYIKDLNAFKRFYLLVVLAFMAIYMAMLGDKSLSDGKNLVFFIFIYVIGNTIKVYSEKIKRIRTYPLFIMYALSNIFLVVFYLYGDLVSKIIWKLAYPYCSPLLVINAVMFFLLIGKLKFKSRIINWAASSSLAIYVIHQQHFILYNVIRPVTKYIVNIDVNPLIIITILCCLTIIIMMISILTDKLITPIYSISYNKLSKLQKRIDQKYGY